MKKLRDIPLSRWYPWFVVILASCMLFYKYLLQVFPSVITDHLMRDFQLTGSGLGNLAACFFYSYLIAQLFSGYLIDRFNFKLIITISMLISASGAWLFASTDQFSLATLGRALMGTGAAFATVGYMKTAAIYFPPQRFGFVSGLLTIGVMLGAVFGEAPLSVVIKSVGWHQALYGIAIAGAVIAALFMLCIRTKPTSQLATATTPRPITLRDLGALLKNKINWYLAFYSGLAFAPLAVFGGLWGTPFVVKAYHLNETTAAFYVSMVYVGFGLGGPLFGYLEERFQQRFALMLSGLVLSLLCLLIMIYGIPGTRGLLIATILFGLGTGAFMLGFAVGKDANPIHIAATVIAFINSGDAVCGALSEPLIGRILDAYNTDPLIPMHFSLHAYHMALITLPVELILGLVLLLRIRQLQQHTEHYGNKEISANSSTSLSTTGSAETVA